MSTDHTDMSNVVKLPDPMILQWLAHEREIIAGLIEIGCNSAEIKHVCAELKPVYLKFARSKIIDGGSTPRDIEAAINDWVSTVVNGLLLHLAIRELSLYRLGRDKSDPPPPRIN